MATASNRDGKDREATAWIIGGAFGLRRLFGFDLFARRGGDDARRDLRTWLADQIEVERRARSSFHLVPIGLIAGSAAVFGAGWHPSFPALLMLALLAPVAARMLSESPTGRAAVLLAMTTLIGAALSILQIERTDTTIFSGEATVRIVGEVLAREADERGRYRYLVAIEKTDRPVLSRPPERARIVVGSRHSPLGIGATYAGLVRLRPPSGPAFPGAYDFAFLPFFEGLGAYGYSLGAPVAPPEAAGTDPPSLGLRLTQALISTRTAMTDHIRESIGGTEGAIAAALITGEQAGIREEAKEWLRVTGLAHVLSISGLHLAIVSGFAMLLIRSALSLVPAVALRVPAKKVAAVAALLVATFYLSISGANVATQRAYVMLVIMLLAVLFDRPALTLRNVSIAAIVVVVLAPQSVVTASFQMSFAATVALIGGYAIIAERSGRRRRPAAGWARKAGIAVLAVAVTSLIAGSATGPYSAYHFHRLAAFGFVANVLTMPLFSFWIMPLALIGSLLIPLGLSTWPLQLMGQGIGVVLLVAEFVSAHLPDQAIGRTTATGLVLMTAAILAAAGLASRLRWSAVPLLLLGLAMAPNRETAPSLLIFEDGKEIATIDDDNRLLYRRARPSGFVADQWDRAFSSEEGRARAGPGADAKHATIAMDCREDVCTFPTRDGLTIAWTEDYEKTGQACDAGDVAIVARAVGLRRCRSGAELVTLRTLRRTGSLAIRRDPFTGRVDITPSIGSDPEKWNRHRLAPWPEYWRNPAMPSASKEQARTWPTRTEPLKSHPAGPRSAGPQSANLRSADTRPAALRPAAQRPADMRSAPTPSTRASSAIVQSVPSATPQKGRGPTHERRTDNSPAILSIGGSSPQADPGP